MDRFKVSGRELVEFYSSETCLSQVFSDVERDLRQLNKVVCKYIVNGKDISESEEAEASTIPLSEVHTLEYISESLPDLLVSVLEGWLAALPELSQKTTQLSEKMRFDGFVESYPAVKELIENCEYLVESIISLKSLLGDKHWAGLGFVGVAEKQTKSALGQAVQAAEKRDFVLLADIIEYELGPAIDLWSRALKELLNELLQNGVSNSGETQSTGMARSKAN